MNTSIRATVFIVSIVTLMSIPNVTAQVPAGGPGRGEARPTPPPSKSVRPPDLKQIRTSLLRAMGWSVGIPSDLFAQQTFYEAAGTADALGLASIEGFSTQKVSPAIGKNLDYNLPPDELASVRGRLAELRVKMTAYHVDSTGADDAARRNVFEFAKTLGVETIVFPLDTATLSSLDKLANEFGINAAIESREDPKVAMSAIAGTSKRIGISADLGAWIEHGIRPIEGLAAVKDRLLVAWLRDRDRLGPVAQDVPVGSGVADIGQFLMEIARQEPPIQEFPGKCSNCYVGFTGIKPLFLVVTAKVYEASPPTFADLSRSVEGLEAAARPAMGYRVQLDSSLLPSTSPDLSLPMKEKKIEDALPRKALATPKKPRKLLVYDLCPLGDFHHLTIAHTNLAIQLMAKYTGAFEPVFSNDPSNLKYPAITQFDAVVLNTTVGESYIDPDVLNGMMRFVREGGGIVGIHAATYASQNLPEYGEMMGAVDGPHRVEQATIKIDDPNSPLTKGFAAMPSLTFTDEFFHFLPTGPYSREKLHVLISIDTAKSDMSRWKIRPDNDYGLAWIKMYGKGRVFDSALGHTPEFFATPAFGQLVLGGIQFALGDLDLDTTPSAFLEKTKK